MIIWKMDNAKHGQCNHRNLYRQIFGCALSIIILILFIILVTWLVLRPTKPKFLLQDTTFYQFNLSSDANFLSSNLQVTISSRNPNERIGIYYDGLYAFAEYKNQQITAAIALPTRYQGHHEVNIWSTFLSGVAVPISPYIANAIGQDESAGFILFYIKIAGRLRWKVGTFISGTYNIDVSCPALFTKGVGKGDSGSSAFRFQQIQSYCSVSI